MFTSWKRKMKLYEAKKMLECFTMIRAARIKVEWIINASHSVRGQLYVIIQEKNILTENVADYFLSYIIIVVNVFNIHKQLSPSIKAINLIKPNKCIISIVFFILDSCETNLLHRKITMCILCTYSTNIESPEALN